MFFLKTVAEHFAKTGCNGLQQGLWNRKLEKQTDCTLKTTDYTGMEMRCTGKETDRTEKLVDCMVR
jgi:hypothetical protein